MSPRRRVADRGDVYPEALGQGRTSAQEPADGPREQEGVSREVVLSSEADTLGTALPTPDKPSCAFWTLSQRNRSHLRI